MGLLNGGLGDGNRFMAMLAEGSARAREAIGRLEESLDHASEESVARLRGHAREMSEQRAVLIDELHKTFVTPLDREDIYNLSQAFEKMAVYACTTLEEMSLLHVTPDEAVRRMVALIREQAEELHCAMQRLAKNPRVACDHANRVLDKEREVEHVYRRAIHDLFAHLTPQGALPEVFYRRELYRHISNMADHAVAAANVLGMVVMKIA